MAHLYVTYRDRGTSHEVAIEVQSIYKECFKPMKVCNNALVAMATGDLLVDTQAMRIVVERRKDIARELAEFLTEALLEIMETDDTMNGYPIEKKEITNDFSKR
jgi:hypothetical protein